MELEGSRRLQQFDHDIQAKIKQTLSAILLIPESKSLNKPLQDCQKVQVHVQVHHQVPYHFFLIH